MRGWFRRLPIHQKLVALALVVTAFALGLALLALAVFDIWRYRETATEEVAALAGVLAENTAASVAFDEPDSAAEVLRSIRVRDVVVKACIYLPDGTLFAAYARQSGSPCAGRPLPTQSWSRLGAAATIVRNARSLGTVYVERDLSDLRRRLNLTALVGVLVFVAAAVSAYLISRRIHASIAGPISALASFAKRFGSDTAADPPDVRTAPDEVGDLSAAFTEMIGRVRLATRDAQEALSREREANRLKDEFLAAVSHELRTPLNAMMGWAQLLGVGEPSNETVRQAAASIVKNAHAQTRVIEDLIDVSRIATGKMRLAIEHVDLRTVVALAADTIQPVAEAKGVRIERRTEDVPCHVMGDRDRLVQILWNLLSNAVKFTPRGGLVTIAVAREGSRVIATVADTGTGIDPAFLPHAFERFRQADGSTTRAHGGLGIGLAIVKELTELHGGEVRVRSEGIGLGATFTVALPGAPWEPLDVRGKSRELRKLLCHRWQAFPSWPWMTTRRRWFWWRPRWGSRVLGSRRRIRRSRRWRCGDGSPPTSWSAIWRCPERAGLNCCGNFATPTPAPGDPRAPSRCRRTPAKTIRRARWPPALAHTLRSHFLRTG